jgi:LTXXQ motif family protein
MWTARVLLAAGLVVCVGFSADARRRHHGYYGGEGEGYSSRSTLDQWRARQQQGQNGEQARDQNSDPAQGDDRRQTGARESAKDSGQSRGQDRDRWQSRGDYRSRYGGDYRSRYDRRRARSLEEWRRSPERQDVTRDREDSSRSREAARGDAALTRGRGGPFGAAIDKLVRGCAAQAAEFENWPFDSIAGAVAPNDSQREALEKLRDAAKQAAQKLSTDCPQDVPAAPAARLEAVEQGIAATLAAYDTVEPKLQAFYGTLNDEQKARLYRDMAAPVATKPAETRAAQDERRERYSSRRHRWRDYAAERETRERDSRVSAQRVEDARKRADGSTRATNAAAPGWSGTCEELSAVLRNWPVREIERDVRLSDAQRVAFYELVTASLKAADTLSSACPAEAALTPVGRMDAMRKRLAAVRAATAAIRPALAHFYEALDQGQKVRFAGMS